MFFTSSLLCFHSLLIVTFLLRLLYYPLPVGVTLFNWVALVTEVVLPCPDHLWELEEFGGHFQRHVWTLNAVRHPGMNWRLPHCDTQFAAGWGRPHNHSPHRWTTQFSPMLPRTPDTCGSQSRHVVEHLAQFKCWSTTAISRSSELYMGR